MIKFKHLFTVILLFCATLVNAHDFTVDGIYYNIKSSADKTVEVTYWGDNGYYDVHDSHRYVGNVTIPSNVVHDGVVYDVVGIGQGAFYYSKKLESVKISDGVTYIAYQSFNVCENLTSLEIPQSVTSIGDAFYCCINLSNITVASGNSIYDSRDNCNAIIETETNTLIVGCKNTKIPNTVTVIGRLAFWGCSTLTSIEIPNSVTTIEYGAFNGCGLTSIIVPTSVTDIDDSAFNECYIRTVVNFSNFVFSKGSSQYGKIALNASDVRNIPNGIAIGDFVFTSKYYLCLYLGHDKNLILPENCNGNNYNISKNTFENNTKLESIIIPKAVISIGTNAFAGCSNLKTVINGSDLVINKGSEDNGCVAYYADNVINGIAIGDFLFSEIDGKYVLDEYLGNDSHIVLPESCYGSSYTIGKNAFAGNSNIHSLTVSTKVEKIEEKAFEGCNIAKVIWLTNTPPDGYERLCGRINYVANNKYTALENVVIFQYLSSNFEIDGTIFVPSNMQERKCCVIDYNVNNSLNNVVINEFVSYKGVDLQVEDVMPYSFYNNSTLGSLTLKNNGKIGKSAFNGCSSLLKLNIPVCITQVEDSAFANCAKLADVVIDDRTTILPLGAKLFDKSPLNSLYIGAKISYLSKAGKDTSPFCGNTYLKSVVITDVESDIYDYEFYGCSGLESAVVGDGVERIGRWAFSGCSSLNDFVFGSNISTIGEEAFSDCTGITKITGRAVLPPVCGSQALEDINIFECKLYVPSINLNAYKTADQWKNFFFIENLVTNDNYVTYMIDGEVYKTLLLTPGKRIIAPYVADTNGYPFAGWNMTAYLQNTSTGDYPIMPDKDITINGSYNYTSIEDIVVEKENVDAIYNLNGLRVTDTDNLKSGIYIMNGKKVLVK